jgi:hypothetical protein
MDADLQDPPEAIPLLIDSLRDDTAAVFAGRRGNYEAFFQLFTSRIYKRLLHYLCGLPKDAGIFVVMKRDLVKRLLKIKTHLPYLLPMIASIHLPMVSIPVERYKSPRGKTSYSFFRRLRLGLRGIYCTWECRYRQKIR